MMSKRFQLSYLRSFRPWGWALYFSSVGLIAVLLLEAGLRFALNPVDFLMPNLIHSDALRHQIAPYSGGHDAWGFRNATVPDHADIVAVGDSTTYGLSAPAHASWPAQLAKLTGKSVYNLGVGGYGPVEYRRVLDMYGTKLSPRVVIIGLYLGNDLYDAYVSASGMSDPEIEKYFTPHTISQRGRAWLATHSMLYAVSKATLPQLVDLVRSRSLAESHGDSAIAAQVVGHINIFTPHLPYRLLDQARAPVAAGLERTKAEIRRMAEACGAMGSKCYLLVIPTKETVAWPLVREALTPDQRKIFEALEHAEMEAARQVRETASSLRMPVINMLEDLRAEWLRQPIYPATDGHPNAAGYTVIARAISKSLGNLEQ